MPYQEPNLSKEVRDFQSQETGIVLELDEIRNAIQALRVIISQGLNKQDHGATLTKSEVQAMISARARISFLDNLFEERLANLANFREEFDSKSKAASSSRAQTAEDQPPRPKVLTQDSERRNSMESTAA